MFNSDKTYKSIEKGSRMRVPRVYANSPFKPLYEHAIKGIESVRKLREVLDAFCEEDFERARDDAEEVSRLEHQSDLIKKDIRAKISSSILLPVDRQDLLSFIKPQDTIADAAEDAALFLTMRKSKNVPKEIKEYLSKMMDETLDLLEAYRVVVAKFSRLPKVTFRKRERREIINLIRPIEDAEHVIDLIELDAARRLFQLEGELEVLEIWHLSGIIKRLSDISNAATKAADRMRTLVFR
ncbi:MAG: hypothetical protein MOIL_01211 [Candidatus Methanolliviera sp. GoM_oil]|nr:MAG: hypothetical protein MOIL_01211 [Candidatus Methanolliviera sp. GoM_oil]